MRPRRGRSKQMVALGLVMAAVVVTVAPLVAMAGSITPDAVSRSIGVGETIRIEKNVTTDPGGASRVDVFFLADNTGSMGGVIGNVRTRAGDLLSGINASIADAGFGVGRYLGDPREGVPPATAYQRQQAINTDAALAQAAINAWFASGGGDFPEANFFALHQVATDGALTPGNVRPPTGTGQVTGWRAGAQRLIVWFGDAPAHTDTISQAQTIAALTGADVTVAGLNSTGAGGGIDTGGQASAVTAATGGALINNFAALSADATLAALLDLIEEVTAVLDLALLTVGDTSGLGIGFACIDARGCDDVPAGESRVFEMSITGLAPGTYEFDVLARGVDGAVERDRIVVEGGVISVPMPSALLLLATGVLGLAALGRGRLKK